MSNTYLQPSMLMRYEGVQDAPSLRQAQPVGLPLEHRTSWLQYDVETEEELNSSGSSFSSGQLGFPGEGGSCDYQARPNPNLRTFEKWNPKANDPLLPDEQSHASRQAPRSRKGEKLRNRALPVPVAAPPTKFKLQLAQHLGDSGLADVSSMSEGSSAPPRHAPRQVAPLQGVIGQRTKPATKWADYDLEEEEDLTETQQMASYSGSEACGLLDGSSGSGSLQARDDEDPGLRKSGRLRNKALPKDVAARPQKIRLQLWQHLGDDAPSMDASSVSESAASWSGLESSQSTRTTSDLVDMGPYPNAGITSDLVDMGPYPNAGISMGSRGHSEGECTPCLFVHAAVGCAEGEGCRFCHMVHRKNKARPCKGKRERYRKLRERLGYSEQGSGSQASSDRGSGAQGSTMVTL